MSLEADLVPLLKALCPRVFPDVAPQGTPAPYITYQYIGGDAWRYTDNVAMNQRHSLIQFNVWDTSRLAALALIRQVEEALCAATAFTAMPENEPVSDIEDGREIYGSMQDFSIVSTR